MANPAIYVDAPTRQPRRGGIRTVAEFVPQSRIGMGAPLEFTSPGCAFPQTNVMLCYPQPATAQTAKTKVGIETMDGVVAPFGLYVGVQCFLEGDDFEARAQELLEQGEDRGIEDAFNTYLQALTSAAATSFVDAVAKAEQAGDDLYLGAPIIWMNRGDAIRAEAAHAIVADKGTGKMYTVNGTEVVTSSSFTANSVAVTGSIAVHHTDIIVTTAPQITKNVELAIAERTYAIALDCEFARVFDIS